MSEHPNAKYTHERLISAAVACASRLNNTSLSIAARQSAEMDMHACHAGAHLIEELDTEVKRLRSAILCYDNGMISKVQLRDVTQDWNGKNTPRPEMPKERRMP